MIEAGFLGYALLATVLVTGLSAVWSAFAFNQFVANTKESFDELNSIMRDIKSILEREIKS